MATILPGLSRILLEFYGAFASCPIPRTRLVTTNQPLFLKFYVQNFCSNLYGLPEVTACMRVIYFVLVRSRTIRELRTDKSRHESAFSCPCYVISKWLVYDVHFFDARMGFMTRYLILSLNELVVCSL